jgi:hypothetical protein
MTDDIKAEGSAEPTDTQEATVAPIEQGRVQEVMDGLPARLCASVQAALAHLPLAHINAAVAAVDASIREELASLKASQA